MRFVGVEQHILAYSHCAYAQRLKLAGRLFQLPVVGSGDVSLVMDVFRQYYLR